MFYHIFILKYFEYTFLCLCERLFYLKFWIWPDYFLFYLLYLIDTKQYYSKFNIESVFHTPDFVHISFNIFIWQKNKFVGAKYLDF